MTLSTPRLGFVGRRRTCLLAVLAVLGVLFLSYQFLRLQRDTSRRVGNEEVFPDEPDEADEKTELHQLPRALRTQLRRQLSASSNATNHTPSNSPTSAKGPASSPSTVSQTRRSCSPPTFISYDQLEALINTTGGAARGRLVHHSWKTAALPPRFWRYSSTWCECFNAWPQVLWTDADNERFARDKFAWFHDVYREFVYPINRLDTLRYMYLLEYGGLYTDLDNLCLRPFEHLLHGYGIVYGDMAASQYKNRPFHFVQNSYDWALCFYQTKRKLFLSLFSFRLFPSLSLFFSSPPHSYLTMNKLTHSLSLNFSTLHLASPPQMLFVSP